MAKNEWPRIRDLPVEEQELFRQWITGQTVPLLPDVPFAEQDGYFPWDYEQWKKEKPGPAHPRYRGKDGR
jgi:hypothetical protein